MQEEWRDIPDTGELYEASSLGRIRSKDRIIHRLSRWGKPIQLRKPGRVLKPWPDGNGYLVVYVCFEGQRIAVNVHRLVARAWLTADPERPEVNHKDGAKAHNWPDNLEWSTRAENMCHARDTGLRKDRKPVIGTGRDGREIVFQSVTAAADHIGSAPSHIFNAMRRGHAARGYQWRFAEAA